MSIIKEQVDFEINRNAGPVSNAFLLQLISTFSEALEWAHQLPYGRNTDRSDYMLIFSEGQGTCSTKHAALAALCRENVTIQVVDFLLEDS